jgi:N-acetylglucosaminyldiphosphoundecaprenol N-acetyl-beta-D-mannosaminyltransferase
MIFCNINFNTENKTALFKLQKDNITKMIIPVNASIITEANKSKRFFNIFKSNYVTFDGTVPLVVAKILSKLKHIISHYENKYIKEFGFKKLSGSDIVYDFCEFAKVQNYKIFFLGGKVESNENAVKIIKKRYNVIIEGYSPDFEDYPFSDQFNDLCLQKIKIFRPDILFVGFGAPKQEYWIDDHLVYLSEIDVKYAIGCGGTFDFVSGKIKRAPIFIQKIGLEGLYRFFQEPSKIRWKRLIDSVKFFKYIWCKPDFK